MTKEEKPGESMKQVQELIQFKIVEKPYEIQTPVFKEVVVETPVYKEVVYEKPVIKEVQYERPVVKTRDLTEGLREMIKGEIIKAMADVIQSLKISFEIPMARILQVRPGGKTEEVTK